MREEKKVLYIKKNKRIVFILSFLLVASALHVFSTDAGCSHAGEETRFAKARVYEINGELRNASEAQVSMGNAGIGKPLELIEENGRWTLRMELKAITPKTGKKNALKGYLGGLKYFPGYYGANPPAANAAGQDVSVESFHDVYDIYNDRKKGIDKLMRGKLYPHYCSMPVEAPQPAATPNPEGKGHVKGRDVYWVCMYVPLMEALNAGGGSRYARLVLDWSSLKEKHSLSNNPKDVGRLSDKQGDKKKPDKDDKGKPKDKSRDKGQRAHKKKKLNMKSLSDGVYAVKGKMLKTDRRSLSMADKAINHTIKLRVKKGKYYLHLRMKGLNMNGQSGYLKSIRYFGNDYKTGSSQIPKGSLNPVKILQYHKAGGKRVSDSYGTDYPREVVFPVIKRGRKDGYLPLQVFVPIMESIAQGTGTQQLYLKMDLNSVTAAKEDSPKFTEEDNKTEGKTAAGKTGGAGLGMFKKSRSAKLKSGDRKTFANSALGDSRDDEERGETGEESKKEPPLKKHVFPGLTTLAVFAGAIPTYKKRKRIFDLLKI